MLARALLPLLVAAAVGCSEPGDGNVAESSAADAPPPAAPAASVTIELADGSSRALDAWQGQYLFVNYWAQWCGPCIEEIPELNVLHAQDTGAQVLGINFDGLDAGPIREQMATLGIAFPVAVGDPSAALGLDLPEVLPSTFVFDRAGKMVAVLRGPQTLATLRAAMAVAATPGGGR